MKKLGLLSLVVALFCYATPSLAVPVINGWPPPGGVSASGSGISPGHTGGKTWTLSGFDDSAYGNLYYGAGDYDGGPVPGPSLHIGSSFAKDPLDFKAVPSDATNGVSVWRGNTQMQVYNGSFFETHTYTTQFTLTVTDLANNPLSLVSAASLGLDPEWGLLLDVTGDFKANWLFEMSGYGLSGWTPATVAFDSLSNHPSEHLYTSVGGSFFSTPSTGVPAPPTILVFALSLLFGRLVLRRG